MKCQLNNCRESILLGILFPLILCLVIYAIIGIYTFYLTDKYHSIDLKQWRSQKLLETSHKYDKLLKSLEINEETQMQ